MVFEQNHSYRPLPGRQLLELLCAKLVETGTQKQEGRVQLANVSRGATRAQVELVKY